MLWKNRRSPATPAESGNPEDGAGTDLRGDLMTAAIQLYPYQQSWFLDRARFKIGMFARQTGKTFTTTLELVDDCFETEASGGTYTLGDPLARGAPGKKPWWRG